MSPAAPQRVQVFGLGRPRADGPRRHYVKWRIDGRDRTRSFKTRAEADRFRSRLIAAIEQGLSFDPSEGVPQSWLAMTNAPTWWSWSREWVELKWPQWSGHSRRSAVETLAMLTPRLTKPGAPQPPDGLAEWLRRDGYQPSREPSGAHLEWLARWSVPLAEIEPGLLERVLHAVTRRADGEVTVPSVTRRRKNLLGSVLRAAVRRGLLPSNPLDRVEWRQPTHALEIDVSTVPSPEDVDAVIGYVADMGGHAARCAALFALVGIAGMRPSEAIGLRVNDLELPDEGWGVAHLRGAITAPGGRYTATGAAVEAKGLKHRARGAVRAVPLSPDAVHLLRQHLGRFEPVEDRVFSNAAGRPMTPSNYGPVWSKARAALWPADHKLATTTVYDLRHAAATTMLRAKVSPAEVARRLGHSVDVLMRVYLGVFSDERDRSNALIDEARGK